jgi:type IV pilus assembly protein PilE
MMIKFNLMKHAPTSRRLAQRFGRAGGYNLVELMVTVAVIGILSAFALPSYQQHVLKANRQDAQAILMETAQFMERYFTTNNAYSGSTDAALLANVSPVSPKGAALTRIKYNIRFVAASRTASAYTLEAVPRNGQDIDTCGTLTLSNTGVQTAAMAGCW